MPRLPLVLFVLLAAAAACGGKLDDGDAGPTPDGSSPHPDGSTTPDSSFVDAIVIHDASTGCTTPDESVMLMMAGCQVSESWSCGTTQYSIQCDCPNATCTCSEQMGGMGSGTIIKAPSVCPMCTGNLAALCGFPQ